MKLKNVLIVVEDIEKSTNFYSELFGLKVIRDYETSLILMEGLVLKEKSSWKELIGRDVIVEHNASELYFEERNMEEFAERLDAFYPEAKYVNRLMTNDFGQKLLRFYDYDGNLIEVASPIV